MDLIDRRVAIKAVEELHNCYNGFFDTYDKACIIGLLEELPSAQPEVPDFISWLIDMIWDDEDWKLNWQAFPEILCRKLVKMGYVRERNGEYERFNQQTGGY